ncbi:MAG: hypothetical protein JXR76_14415 [Deltaproteobacteria bacterium]|nr:hypothetical protein [Deltaproteobacteria bacterium]
MKQTSWLICIGTLALLAGAGCGDDANNGGIGADDTDSDSESTTQPSALDSETSSATEKGTDVGTDTSTLFDTASATEPEISSDTTIRTDTNTGSDSPFDTSSAVDPPGPACTSPVSLRDVSNPDEIVGDGTATSCTEEALRSAVQNGGTIVFNCGSVPSTIFITQTIELPNHKTTVIDGGGLITLDAQKRTRHFYFNEPDWMNNPDGVVLQRLAFRNGKAPATDYHEQDTDNPNCAYGYADGSGGVLYVRNGVVHIVDCEFYDNEAALIGPDVGGGAIYVVGVPELIISGSVFVGNKGANGGAVGMLFCGNPGIYNSLFENNAAVGLGQNGCCDTACVGVGHENQTGAGGNSGAVYLDGLNDEDKVFHICGTVFRNNSANELGGALFRTPNSGDREMHIDNSVFDGNTAALGGVSFIKDHTLTVRNTTIMNNSADAIGGLWVNQGTMDIENCTVYNNHPTGLIVDNPSSIKNSTIVDSPLDGNFTVTNSLFVDMDCNSAKSGSDNLQWPQGDACAEGTTFADPQLGEIGDNGGCTPTFLPGDTVLGIGADCPAKDQRGESRSTTSCAAGSVEP